MLQEGFELGERVRAWTVEVQAAGTSTWSPFASGTAIGARRLSMGEKRGTANDPFVFSVAASCAFESHMPLCSSLRLRLQAHQRERHGG
jgi:hypothetical protein